MGQAFEIMFVSIIITVAVSYLVALLIHMLGVFIHLGAKKKHGHGEDADLALAIAVAMAQKK